jgi:ABC-type multidrug transport system ATPase subunit
MIEGEDLTVPLAPRSDKSTGEYVPSTANTTSFAIQWTDLSFSVPVKGQGNKLILDKLSGHLSSGELLALIGGSGSGKTTLLNCLSQRFGKYPSHTLTGTILVDGNPPSPSRMKKISSYLEQEEYFHPNLTVREIVDFVLQLSGGTEDRQKKINDIAMELNLLPCLDTRIGSFDNRGISGGETRRLSLGVELIFDRTIVFLDEPTSGLDSFNSLLVMSILKRLTK